MRSIECTLSFQVILAATSHSSKFNFNNSVGFCFFGGWGLGRIVSSLLLLANTHTFSSWLCLAHSSYCHHQLYVLFQSARKKVPCELFSELTVWYLIWKSQEKTFCSYISYVIVSSYRITGYHRKWLFAWDYTNNMQKIIIY